MRIGRGIRPVSMRCGPICSEQPVLDALSEGIYPNDVSADITDNLRRNGFPFREAQGEEKQLQVHVRPNEPPDVMELRHTAHHGRHPLHRTDPSSPLRTDILHDADFLRAGAHQPLKLHVLFHEIPWVRTGDSRSD